MLRISRTALVAGLLLAAAPVLAQDREGREATPLELLEDAQRLTSRYFYNKRVLREKGWDAIVERYRDQAREARGREEAYKIINAMIGELKTSHLALVDARVWRDHLRSEFSNAPTPRLGAELVEIDGALYIGGLLEGGPAAKAGLLTGDQVVAINGRPPLDAEDLLGAGHDPGLPGHPGYVLIVEDGEEVRFTVRSRDQGPTRAIAVTAAKMTMMDAMENSIRVVERGGKRIGVIHLWHFMNNRVVRIVRGAMAGAFRDVDGLVFDIRGRGGSAAVVNQLLNLFRGRRAIWSRPVSVLIDGHTRSAKEIFAWQWRRESELGPLVGQRTQGACIATIFRTLRDGSVMLLPAYDVSRISGGENLEGQGVPADVTVEEGELAFRRGRDPILERGLAEVAGRITRPKKRTRAWF